MPCKYRSLPNQAKASVIFFRQQVHSEDDDRRQREGQDGRTHSDPRSGHTQRCRGREEEKRANNHPAPSPSTISEAEKLKRKKREADISCREAHKCTRVGQKNGVHSWMERGRAERRDTRKSSVDFVRSLEHCGTEAWVRRVFIRRGGYSYISPSSG